MTNDECRYFVAVYNCRSFSDAARKMNISSQGIGKAIKSVEAQLGVQLFTRTPQGVIPTSIATNLYQCFCNILAEEDRIRDIVAASLMPVGVQTLIGRDSRLGDAIGFGIKKYCQLHDARIELMFTRDSEDVQAKAFVENGYDYRFLSVELDNLPELVHAPLVVLHYVPVVNVHSELASKKGFSIDDLRGKTILTESLYHTPMRLLAKLCRERGFEPKFRAIEKTYIWEVLRSSSEDVTFIRTNEVNVYPWTQTQYYAIATMNPPLDTQIVLQTTHDTIDDELIRCIRESLIKWKF